MSDELERREWVPDLDQVAHDLVRDLKGSPGDDDAQARLDAIATLDGLDQDDLVALAILLAERLAQSPDPGHGGTGQ